jgi:hypothetical protein
MWCDGARALPCLVRSKCLGPKCNEGHTGPLCETCVVPGWYNTKGSDNSCRRCDSNFALIVGLILGAYTFVALCVAAHRSLHPNFWIKWSMDSGAVIARAIVGVHLQRLVLLHSLSLPFPDLFRRLLRESLSTVLNGGVGVECFNVPWSFTSYWLVVVCLVLGTFVLAFVFEALRVAYSRTCGRLVHARRVAAILAAKDAADQSASASASSLCLDADWGCNAIFRADTCVLADPSNPETSKCIDTITREQYDPIDADTKERFDPNNKWWRRLRNSPLLALTRFLGAGVLWQVCIKACTWQTVGSDRMQVHSVGERFDAPAYSVYIGVSAALIFVIGAFAIFLTLDLCSRTWTDFEHDNASERWKQFRRIMATLRQSPLLKITSGVAAGRSVTGSVDARTAEFVSLDYEYSERIERERLGQPAGSVARPVLAPAGQEWALHVYMLSSLLTPLAFTFHSYFDTSEAEQRKERAAEAAWLVVIDLAVMLLVAALSLRRLCVRKDVRTSARVDSCIGVVGLLGANAQLVFFSLVGLTTTGISISCTVNDCKDRDDLSLALIAINFGVILLIAGRLAVRVCCCKVCGGAEEENCCKRRCGTDEDAFKKEEEESRKPKELFLEERNRNASPAPVLSALPAPASAPAAEARARPAVAARVGRGVTFRAVNPVVNP